MKNWNGLDVSTLFCAGDAIEVNEILHGVIVTYDQLVSNETMQKTSTKTETQLTDLLAPTEAHKEADTKTPLNPLDELSDIFSQNLKATPIAPSIDLLEPIAVKATSSLPKVEPCIKGKVEVFLCKKVFI